MTEEMTIALSLLLTGMITVFVVLSLVVLSGNILIRFVNRFLPAPEENVNSNKQKGLSPSKVAAITAAVDIVTKGRGRVTKIE